MLESGQEMGEEKNQKLEPCTTISCKARRAWMGGGKVTCGASTVEGGDGGQEEDISRELVEKVNNNVMV
jgi:hypothetical protein